MATTPKRGGLGRGLGALIPSGLTDSATAVKERQPTEESISAPAVEPEAPAVSHSDDDEPVAAVDVSRETSTAQTENDGPRPVPGARFQLIEITSITANPKQPRQIFDDESLEELQTSLQEVGMLQPIGVRERTSAELAADPELTAFELVMGERRLRAATMLGWEAVPAIVRQTTDDEMLREALLENIHRVQLNPLEEGAAYKQLLDEFGVTQEQLAKRIGRSRPQISNTIRLLSLPPTVQTKVAAGVITAGHARALLGLESNGDQEHIAERIISEGLSVRSTEELIMACRLQEKPDLSAEETKAAKAGKKASITSRMEAPGLEELKERLSDHFETKVNVSWGRKKGKIVIEFGSLSDLDRIVEQLKIEDSTS
ncbi:ParB/RepB/Spo0J family partition protein [Natronoglycomyces albus]|uniref:ParB/RepB/Spo0J family partition protein n=1 Tax=Natronoglycomyces albus TaxID=2811108 RepID=A0A895XPS1_9ACTN|nr:ParB/RepB/Spo0J family partition protein [Natronoglycomyces albus]QSB05369.1 ParB/RepB/Spo0J family partition protein [Natronoglycomyces albus]